MVVSIWSFFGDLLYVRRFRGFVVLTELEKERTSLRVCTRAILLVMMLRKLEIGVRKKRLLN